MSALSKVLVDSLNQGINDAKHRALNELESQGYNLASSTWRETSPDPNEVLAETLHWILGLANLNLDQFLDRNNLRPTSQWGRGGFDEEVKSTLLKLAVARVRSKLTPCDAQYLYPGRILIDRWVLPPGMTAETGLQSVLFGQSKTRRFGNSELTWDDFVAANVLTVEDLIRNPDRLKVKKGVGKGAVADAVASLASVGFIDSTVKQIAR